MLWNIKSAENLISGDFAELIKDGDGNLGCKKILELGSITAIAARGIAEGEILTFDTNGDTKDLTTPKSNLAP
jgi:hypothetical protein